MYSILRLSIILNILGVIHLSHVKSNSISKLERNNVLNKALWVKRNAEKSPGLSVFKLNSFDVDEILDNNKGGNGHSTMYFSSFNERDKRETLEVLNENKKNMSITNAMKIVDDSYKEAGLLPQTDHYNIIHNIPPHPYTYTVQSKPKYFANMSDSFEKIMKPLIDNIQNLPKNDSDKSILNTESNNQNVFNKTFLDKKWFRNGQLASSNLNDTAKRSDEDLISITKFNKISQTELFKIIEIFTKTFKRIIKQHNDIAVIHSRLQNLKNNFMRYSEHLLKKFQNFDSKYNNLIKINEQLNEKLQSVKNQQLNIKLKEETLSKYVLDLEKQRKQFLLQQSLFFNVQKQILAQNEKITYKQAQIANRQTIISHRQGNIARIFKEANQIFTTTEKVKAPEQIKIVRNHDSQNKNSRAPAVDSVKIDLFSVKPDKELKTLDSDILKEKDAQSIDDLIYKFYFNNTFIDDFIRNQLLNNVVHRPDNRDLKVRKPRLGAETTILWPATGAVGGKLRERRWIKHTKKKSQNNESTTVISIKAKMMNARTKKDDNSDPFVKMAMTFCTELGQTNNVQAFNWCVEKSLRRLKVIDSKNTATSIPSTVSPAATTSAVTVLSTKTLAKTRKDEASLLAKYFPDNDELEEKLKDFELKPDTEGNVYYDRSLHISDIDPKEMDDGGVSDIVPDYDGNNYKMAVDPPLQLGMLKRAGARR